ncbi:MAG TPA: hypothetical protein VLS27_19255, partial [Gammaproteobacteria bacterium]|nr:hypothetical protein [Gammaproteobacteria bacterium]
RALKFVRFATEHRYPRVPVEEAALALLDRMKLLPSKGVGNADGVALLAHFRRMDRAQRRIRLNTEAGEVASRVAVARL